MFLSTMQTLPIEGHNVEYQCTGLDQSNSVCEYEVNLPANEKVIIVKEQCWISRSSEGQCNNAGLWKGLDLSNNGCDVK